MDPADDLGRRARKRQDTLEKVTTVAGQLFRRDGFDAVTMDQIAEAADIARGTLYNHFAVKDAVLAAWVHQELARDLQGFWIDDETGFADGTAQLLELSARWCIANRAVLPPYLRSRFLDMQASAPAGGPSQVDGLVALYAALIRNSQRRGEISAGLDAEQLATLFHHLYLAALLRWLGEPRLDLRAEFAFAVELFLRGCAE